MSENAILQANQVILTDKIAEQNESIKNYLQKQKETMQEMAALEVAKQEGIKIKDKYCFDSQL